MPSETIAVLGTLSGVLIGGFINYLASRSVKNHEWKLALAKEQSTIRHKLYAEFLVETQRLVVQAREEKISSLADLNMLNGKFAEVSLVASGMVVEAAKKLADYVITSHSAQPAKEVADFFKLKEAFIAVARQDIAEVLSGGA
ncbi:MULTISPECIES: hypothetical protein [Azospira]|jgi:ribosomal protein L1|uniref:hypothetical protein n=1 Tax=Azospira TaxID=146937 RepID=UPI0005C1669B|nr:MULTISPECIES: hypothetical protein [Azospira]BBN89765.1 hypothetical protein AZSP09_27880 [Azospira sp. I09]GBG03633.1 hypothetical protein AZSI13_29600 [Azospira sp. I13]